MRIFILSIVKKKPRLNILISHGDIKDDTELMGHTIQQCFSTFFVVGPFKFNVKLSRSPSIKIINYLLLMIY
jgi:hypothetical protein